MQVQAVQAGCMVVVQTYHNGTSGIAQKVGNQIHQAPGLFPHKLKLYVRVLHGCIYLKGVPEGITL